MNTNDATRATAAALPEAPRTMLDGLDLLDRAIHLNQLVFMAGHNLDGRAHKSAIATGCDLINDILRDARSAFEELHEDQVAREASI
ncbi:hypothetical protein [Aquamicrobium defluvii]|uniref:DUF3077 family protein n=1 Tax=Aquamicrobium defluvii TaxID=69279 RepID=A0A011UR96_9HYPH|nr:hypothetical protein [Aquamicrobium defluvii]EXL08741.1 hypothetical protein BG36_03610 [Aquamicrobium defluvii]EZQ14892.1 hypothetical protein CF98_14790 [Halopseudomonas bauzanensis]